MTKFVSKLVFDDIDFTPIMVYYRRGMKDIRGNLVRAVDGTYYKRKSDGGIFPVIVNGNGDWMTVINEQPEDTTTCGNVKKQ